MAESKGDAPPPDRSAALAFYDTSAAAKYRTMMQSEDELKFYRADLEELLKLARPGLPLLDVGCGTGDLLAIVRAASPTHTLVGSDIAETMLNHAQTLVPSATFSRGDATNIDLADNSVGALVCSFVTHHLVDSELAAAVAEFARVAAPGAPVYHCYWHGEGDMDGFSETEDGSAPPPLIKRTSETVGAMFCKAGLQLKTRRLDTYEWGDMAFEIYTANLHSEPPSSPPPLPTTARAERPKALPATAPVKEGASLLDGGAVSGAASEAGDDGADPCAGKSGAGGGAGGGGGVLDQAAGAEEKETAAEAAGNGGGSRPRKTLPRMGLYALTKGLPHAGSRSGCGGNPKGTSRGGAGGNCSGCSHCGASTHFNCCGKRAENSDKSCDGAHFAFYNPETRASYVNRDVVVARASSEARPLLISSEERNACYVQWQAAHASSLTIEEFEIE